MDLGTVLVGAWDHLVAHPGMGTTAPKAERVLSKRKAQLICCIRIVSICSLDVLSGVVVEGYIRLARIHSCVGVERLTANGFPDDECVHLILLLREMHSAEDDREPAALMGSKQSMGLTVVGVVTKENGGEALVKTVNELVANRNRKANVLLKG
jgi:hypothetical protein